MKNKYAGQNSEKRIFTRKYSLINSLCLLVILAPMLSVYAVEADNIKDMFYKANAMYSYVEYHKAASEYEKIINKGWVSGPVFYNMGNCYFKDGKLGRAMLSYEKAKRLMPRDSDLESNYKYAKSLIKGRIINGRKPWFIDRLFGSFTIDGLAVLLSVLYLGILSVVILSLYIEPVRKYEFLIITSFIIIFVPAFMEIHAKISLLGNEAVIIGRKIPVRFEPFERATVYFDLYGGRKVKVLLSQGNWCKIKRWDGKKGWVEKKYIDIF